MDPKALLTALVGEHHREYMTSSSFHFAINHLAAMLPDMVEGLLIGALQHDAQIEQRIKFAHDIAGSVGQLLEDGTIL